MDKKQKLLRNNAFQTVLASLICIVIGLIVGFVVFLIIFAFRCRKSDQ